MILVLALALLATTPDWEFSTALTHPVSLAPGSNGLWAATTGGVFRFEYEGGVFAEMLQYPDDLPGIVCNDVLEATDGLLWIATDDGGLAMREDNVWSVFTSFDGIPGDGGRIYCLEQAGGWIWAGTTAGMARGQEDGFIPVDGSTSGGAFPSADVYDLEFDGEVLWAATGSGVLLLQDLANPLSPDSWTSFEEETEGLGIFDLASDGTWLAAAGDEGVWLFNGSDWRLILADSTVSEVAWGDWGLMAASDGIQVYDDGMWEPLGTGYPESILGPYFADGLLMHEGTLWCGLGSYTTEDTGWGRGLGKLSSQSGPWTVVTVPGIPSNGVYQILPVGNRLYMGSHKGGLLGMYPEGWTAWGMDQGLPRFLRVYGCAPASGDGIWCSTYHYGITWLGGTATPDPSDDTLLTFAADSIEVPAVCSWTLAPLLNNQVLMLARQGDILWMPQEAFWQTPEEPSGLTGLTGAPPDTASMVWASFETGSSGLAAKNLKTVFPAGDDLLWIALASGGCQLFHHGGTLTDLSDDSWLPGFGQSFTTSDGLPSEIVNCFGLTQEGQLLVGTGAGLCVYNGAGGFSQVSGVTGSIKAIAVDGEGRIWCNGTNGITLIENGEVTLFDDSNSPFLVFDRVEGEFAGVSPDGKTVYFSSGDGLWSLTVQGGGEPSADGPRFYPQPWRPAEGPLRMCDFQDEPLAGEPVSAAIFSLEGDYLTTVTASMASEWQWDGLVEGSSAGSGIYLAVLTVSGERMTSRLVLVR
jgi:hypothetical protein